MKIKKYQIRGERAENRVNHCPESTASCSDSNPIQKLKHEKKLFPKIATTSFASLNTIASVNYFPLFSFFFSFFLHLYCNSEHYLFPRVDYFLFVAWYKIVLWSNWHISKFTSFYFDRSFTPSLAILTSAYLLFLGLVHGFAFVCSFYWTGRL